MTNRNLVVIGASAGGVEALSRLLVDLPPTLPAAVLIVLHTSGNSDSLLPSILQRCCRLPVAEAQDRRPLRPGWIFTARPDFHLLVEDGALRVIAGPRENRHRPAIDPLFRSAARNYGSRAIGVVLTGMLDDGTSGLMLLRASGGQAVIQDPDTAMFPGMPAHALARVPDALVLPLEQIGTCIARLAAEKLPDFPQTVSPSATSLTPTEILAAMGQDGSQSTPSKYLCPECGRALNGIHVKESMRFRCQIGHAYTASSLEAAQSIAVDTALWSALRALEEKASLHRRMAEQNFHGQLADTYRERARETEQNVQAMRAFLMDRAQRGTK